MAVDVREGALGPDVGMPTVLVPADKAMPKDIGDLVIESPELDDGESDDGEGTGGADPVVLPLDPTAPAKPEAE